LFGENKAVIFVLNKNQPEADLPLAEKKSFLSFCALLFDYLHLLLFNG